MKISALSLRQLIEIGPWLGAGILTAIAALVIGMRAYDISTARSDLNALLQRTGEAKSLRDRLRSEAHADVNPVLEILPQRSLAFGLRQRIEHAGSGFAQIFQLQVLERQKSEGYDLNGFWLAAQLPARELERWLFNMGRLPPNLLIDRVEVRMASPSPMPVEARLLAATLSGRVIVDDQLRKP